MWKDDVDKYFRNFNISEFPLSFSMRGVVVAFFDTFLMSFSKKEKRFKQLLR